MHLRFTYRSHPGETKLTEADVEYLMQNSRLQRQRSTKNCGIRLIHFVVKNKQFTYANVFFFIIKAIFTLAKMQ